MCGLILVAQKGAPILDDSTLVRAINTLSHRGPDHSGHRLLKMGGLGEFGLGHVRLRIKEPTTLADQPYNPCNQVWILFNGEIFNCKHLCEELSATGEPFFSESDTKVLGECYLRWGESCFDRFNGFFAVVILDTRPGRECIIAARDRFSIKPLYYRIKPDQIVLSSEIKAIKEYTGEPIGIDKDSVVEMLCDDKVKQEWGTCYKEIYEFPAGGVWKIGLEDSYFDSVLPRSRLPQFQNIANDLTHDQAIGRFEQTFHEVLKNWVESEGEIAISLSSGVDSTAIAIGLANLGLAKRVHAFTAVIEGHEPSIYESTIAEETAKSLGFNFHSVKIPTHLEINKFLHFARHQEQPFTSPSQYVAYRVFEAVKDAGFKYCITGQGADELFLGYQRYTDYACFLNALLFKEKWRTNIINSRVILSALRYYVIPGLFSLIQYIRKKRIFKSVEFSVDRPIYRKISINTLKDIQYNEVFGRHMLPRLLRYDDRSSSSFGLEARPVFLDLKLAEFAFSLPSELLIRNGVGKFIVRKYLAKYGYDHIANNRVKLGFPTPKNKWYCELLNYTKLNGVDRDINTIFDIKNKNISNAFRSEKVAILHATAIANNWCIPK